MSLIQRIYHNTLFICTVVYALFLGQAQAQNIDIREEERPSEEFVSTLRQIGYPVDEILQSQAISRYDVARLLNAVECQDCVNPSPALIDNYTSTFRSNFIIRPGENFRDIFFEQTTYNNEEYYYCVAYAADNEYMNGYPVATSPVCPGNFCGAKYTTTAEFLQIIMNIVEQYTYQNYSINRAEVQERKEGLTPGSYADRYMNEDDEERIAQGVQQCESSDCPLQNRWEFKTYRKFCTFEIERCNNQAFGHIQAGWRPIAELNVLWKENILTDDQVHDRIHEPVNGEFVLATFERIFPLIDCRFNTDYDCDKIQNREDNCPNIYNPTQHDTDQDGIGNPCDDDIDGDGIKNPLGIVDDRNRLVISVFEESMDNCLFTPNPDQKNTDTQRAGDACQDQQKYIGLAIETEITDQKQYTISVQAAVQGTVENIIRTMGDGTRYQTMHMEEVLFHQYKSPGIYTIIARAKGKYNQAIARSTVHIQGTEQNQAGIQANQNSLMHEGSPIMVEYQQSNTQGNIRLMVNDMESKQGESDSYQITLPTQPYTSITATHYSPTQEDTIIGVSQHYIGYGPTGRGIALVADTLQGTVSQPMQFNTMTQAGDAASSIQSIVRDFGDGEIRQGQEFTQTKSYDNPGSYVVRQNIQTIDGDTFTTYITIFVQNTQQNQTFNMIPNRLQGNIQQPFRITNTDNNDARYIFNQYNNTVSDNSEHTYTSSGIFFPRIQYTQEFCKTPEAQATVVVQENEECLAHALGETTKNQCDMDEDGIPDICDDDIDGDEMPNIIGAVLQDNEDCSINENNINPEALLAGTDVCSIDNCPFTNNEDQSDLNTDGIGDACMQTQEIIQTEQWNKKDSDGDGYTDENDACPYKAENFNSIEDQDGCPEIVENDPCLPEYVNTIDTIDSSVASINCLSCPCHFADYGGSLQQEDKVRAVLTDPMNTIDYTRSFSRIIP